MSNKVREEAINKAIALIKQFEGFRANAYKDSAGVLTIGYGETLATVINSHVMKLKNGSFKTLKPVTEATATRYLEDHLQRIEGVVLQQLPLSVELSSNQLAALYSFIYNVGQSAFINSTLLKALKSGDFERVIKEWKRWDKATVNGKKVVLSGLTKRRLAESNLFNTK